MHTTSWLWCLSSNTLPLPNYLRDAKVVWTIPPTCKIILLLPEILQCGMFLPKSACINYYGFPSLSPNAALLFGWLSRTDMELETNWRSGSIISSATCLLCSQSGKFLQPLFFSCLFSRSIWTSACSLCSASKLHHSWQKEIGLVIGTSNGKRFHKVIRELAWEAMVYYLCQERNFQAFRRPHRSPDYIVKLIKHNVRVKASLFRNVEVSSLNSLLCKNGLVPPTVLVLLCSAIWHGLPFFYTFLIDQEK